MQIEIPVNVGTLPDIDTQTNNPRLEGGFVDEESQVKLLPTLKLRVEVPDLKAIFKSSYKDRTIVVTKTAVFYEKDAVLTKVADFVSNAGDVRIDENTQNEVIIVNGSKAAVYRQLTDSFFILNAAQNGFDLTNPVDVCVLDTFAVIVGGIEKKWIVSQANDATDFSGNEVIVTDNSMGDLTGCRDLSNNLFIFGTGGVQRWIPSIERTTNSFPFSQDPTYRDEYGCAQTATLVSEKNEMFYLTSDSQIRRISPEGSMIVNNDGISQLIKSYNADLSYGSYFYWKGYYFYFITFLGSDDSISLLYCSATKKWAESQQDWLGYADGGALSDGIYDLSDDYSSDFYKLVLKTPFFTPKKPDVHARTVLNSVTMLITQGKSGNLSGEKCMLQLSKDNVVFSNRVTRLLAPVGKRLYQFRWYMNWPNDSISMRFELQVKRDITLKSVFAEIN